MVTLLEALPLGVEVVNETEPLVVPVFHVTDMEGTGFPLLAVLDVPVITPPERFQFIVVFVVHEPEIVYV